MPESERQRRLREAREAQRIIRERAQQTSLDAAAWEEAAIERAKERGDRDWEIDMKRLLGDDLDDIADMIHEADKSTSKDIKAAGDALQKITKLRGQKKYAKAKKVAKQKKSVIKKGHAQAKKQKGSSCPLVALGLIGVLGATGWGLFEAVTSILA